MNTSQVSNVWGRNDSAAMRSAPYNNNDLDEPEPIYSPTHGSPFVPSQVNVNTPPPPSRDDPANLVEKESKVSRYASFLFTILAFLGIFAALAISFYGHRISSITEIISLDRELAQLPSTFTAIGFCIVVTMGIGLLAVSSRGKSMGFAFILALMLLNVMIEWQTRPLEHPQSEALSTTLSTHWDDLPDTARSTIQNLGECCGFDNPTDRPQDTCDEEVSKGCKYTMGELAINIRQTRKMALFTWYLYSFILTIAIILAIYYPFQ